MRLRYLIIDYPEAPERELQYWNDSQKMWIEVMQYVVSPGQEYRDAILNPNEDPTKPEEE